MLCAFILYADVMQGFCKFRSAQPALFYHCEAAMVPTRASPLQVDRFRPGRVPKPLQAARMSCDFQVPRVTGPTEHEGSLDGSVLDWQAASCLVDVLEREFGSASVNCSATRASCREGGTASISR